MEGAAKPDRFFIMATDPENLTLPLLRELSDARRRAYPSLLKIKDSPGRPAQGPAS
jgi:hypothetical protein